MVITIVILVLVASVIADIFFFIWWFRRLRAEAIEAIKEAVSEEDVHEVGDCNFFGRQSAGLRQWRGNGMLALTDRGIHFRMFFPRRELFVAHASIREVSQPRSFLSKSKAKPLLRVDFWDQAGGKDACAWLVRDPQWWQEAIYDLRAGGEPPPPPWKDA